MNIGIYDPYLNILGGAERYVLAIAGCYSSGATITFFGADADLLKMGEKKFGMHLGNYKCESWPKERGVRDKMLAEFDLFFYVTDGSIFRSTSKKSVLIIQTPDHMPHKTLLNNWKFGSWNKIICYSHFIKDIIRERMGRSADTLFVPISLSLPTDYFQKENIILTVGRFFPNLHNKKQLEMVEMFGEMIQNGLAEVKLFVVGSIDPGGEEYFQKVQLKARSLPVYVKSGISNQELEDLYKKAKIYWHAAGLGEDLVKNPEKAEHFGVATVEAMNHGAVPLVFPGGGQTEIVTHGQDGYHWRTVVELEKYTHQVLKDQKLFESLSMNAFDTSLKYSTDAFCKRLHEIIEK